MVRISMDMPPKDGMALGTMMFEPRPVEFKTGIGAGPIGPWTCDETEGRGS